MEPTTAGVFAEYPSLRGKSILVSGGASGIGASIVESFARQGARVTFVDIDESSAESVLEQCRNADCVPQFRCVDVSQIDAYQKVIAEAETRMGGIDVLVNNAASDERHDFLTLDYAKWKELVAVNLDHLAFAAQAVARSMRIRRSGSIINLGSISHRVGGTDMLAYATSNAGIEGLTRSLARLLGRDEIRVNCVVPGWVMTDRQVERWLTPESERKLLEQQALKSRLHPSDIARAVLFLAADDSKMMTGQRLVIDGGWT